MILLPAPLKEGCAKDICEERQPAASLVAGILLLITLLFPPMSVADSCASSEGSGPEMVMLPRGTFTMGSPDNEAGRDDDEGPQHGVSVEPFAIMACEVTRGEFRRFVEAEDYITTAESSGEGCYHNSAPGENDWDNRAEFTWRNALHGEQDDSQPVVCVSWDDAMEYAAWLNRQIGEELYRLPSEAEWEYAARAGSSGAREFGDRPQCLYANGADQQIGGIYSGFTVADCNDGWVHTSPVASFAANSWGLYDTLGNVWEWTADCWHDNYQNAPDDGQAWNGSENGNCSRRVLRGGSWLNLPVDLRSANRNWNSTDSRGYFIVGFRLARTLRPLPSDL